jgi:glutamyl-tRNA synthetase
LLYEAFEWEAPQFAHLPLLLKPDGNGKLSKRDGDRLGFPVFPTNWVAADGELYSGYRENGYFPEAFINMLAFLGWNPGTTQEIFSLDELCEAFTLERVAKAGAKFDADKTRWFQQHYLRATPNEELAAKLSQILTDKHDLTRLATICGLMKERATFVEDILTEGSFLFGSPESYDETTVSKKWNEGAAGLMQEWKEKLSSLPSFEASGIEEAFKAFIAEKEMGIGAVLPLFRLLVTGKGMGPSMFEISAFLGKEACVERIELGIAALAQHTANA